MPSRFRSHSGVYPCVPYYALKLRDKSTNVCFWHSFSSVLIKRTKMRSTLTKMMLGFTLISVLASCNSAEKQLLSGEYEKAFESAIEKLGKPNRKNKDEFILLIEDAFAFANQEDNETILLLQAEGRSDRWLSIIDIYEDMKYRQDMLRPHLPLFIKDEHRYAEIEIIDLVPSLADAKHQAAAYLYEEAVYLLNSNRKQEARDAYDILCNLHSISGSYKDSRILLEDARFIGTERITVEIRNKTGHAVPTHVMKELKRANLSNLNEFWVEYLNYEPADYPPDYRVFVKLESVNVTQDFRNELHYSESKTLLLGQSDTSGVKVKERVITANVVETKQHKAAKISGRIEYMTGNGRQLIKSIPVFAEVEFLNISACATGNLEALKPETKEKLSGGILPFPNNHQMLSDAQHQFEVAMLGALNQHRALIEL
ncbi:MAG: hypothetical protein ACI959_001216 [Limisphaerales bacterium]